MDELDIHLPRKYITALETRRSVFILCTYGYQAQPSRLETSFPLNFFRSYFFPPRCWENVQRFEVICDLVNSLGLGSSDKAFISHYRALCIWKPQPWPLEHSSLSWRIKKVYINTVKRPMTFFLCILHPCPTVACNKTHFTAQLLFAYEMLHCKSC